jgi:AAA domain
MGGKGIMTYEEGGGGIGKSYIVQQESACVAAGYPILGSPVEQVDVCYLNYEEPQAEFERRLYRVRKSFGTRHMPDGRSELEWRNEAGAHLLRVTRNGQVVVTRFGRQFRDQLARRRDSGKHTKLVFDGLTRSFLRVARAANTTLRGR